jgi:hypothetical protein
MSFGGMIAPNLTYQRGSHVHVLDITRSHTFGWAACLEEDWHIVKPRSFFWLQPYNTGNKARSCQTVAGMERAECRITADQERCRLGPRGEDDVLSELNLPIRISDPSAHPVLIKG